MSRFYRVAILFLASSCLLAALCMSTATAAIPNSDNPEAYTEKKYRQDLLEYNKRTMSEAYRQVGTHDPRWDDLVIEYLDAQAEVFTNQGVKPQSRVAVTSTPERIQELTKLCRESGCTDPMALYVCLVHADKKAEGYEAFVRRVCLALMDSAYPINRRIAAASRYMKTVNKNAAAEEYEMVERAWIDLVCSAATDPELPIETQHFIIRTFEDELLDDAWLERWLAVCQRIDVESPVNPWMVGVICGYSHVEQAWKARGKGWASTVTDEGWRGFRDHLEQARRHLSRAWRAAPQYPHAAYKMISVSMGQGSGEERLWFERAVNAQFDYYRAYSAYLWSIRPRWGGSFGKMYGFATECLDTNRFDTRVPTFFYTAMQDIAEDDDAYDYWKRDGIYEQFITYFEARKSALTPESDAQWWDSMKAAVAWRVGRYNDAYYWMKRLGDGLDTKTFTKFDGEPELAIGEVVARVTVDPAVFDEARRRWQAEEFRSAAEVINTAVQGLKPDDPARPYMRHLAVWAQRLHDQQTGVWIDMLGQPDLCGWIVKQGDWSVDDMGRVTALSNKYGWKLECRFNTGYRCEIQGTVSFPVDPPPQEYSAGVLLAFRVIDSKHNHRSVLLDRGAGVLESAQNYTLRKKFPAMIASTNRFHIQMWDEYLRVSINDEVVVEGLKMDYPLPDKVHPFAIGGRAAEPGVVVRFDELKARRLTQRPAWAVDRPEPVEADPMSADDKGQEE